MNRMNSRYPEDSNIIDFIEVKLLAMAEEYASAGKLSMAEAVWNALDSYVAENIDIVFKAGQPYVINRKNTVEFIDIEDELDDV